MVAIKNKRLVVLVFRVAGQPYAVRSSDVDQIAPMAELDCPPGVPKLLAGFLNLQGQPVPVIRVHHLFDLPQTPLRLWTPLVILDSAGERLALLVDEVIGILSVAEEAILPLPNHHVVNECVTGIVRLEEESLLWLAPERLLLEKESQTIAELQQMVSRRIDELEGVEA